MLLISRGVIVFAVALIALCLASPQPSLAQQPAAARPPAWTATADGAVGLEVMKDSATAAKLGTICWGPGWAWFGFEGGKVSVDPQSRRIATSATKIGGNNKPLNLTYQLRQQGSNKIVIGYELLAPEAAELIGVACGLEPSQMYRGGKVVATLEDGSTQEAPIPLGRGAIPDVSVKRLVLRTAAGAEPLMIDINPPRKVASDGGVARIWVLGNQIAASQKVSTTLTVTTPAPARFFAKDEDASVRNITPDWFAYPVGQGGVPIDLSFLNKDAKGNYIPAGTHGFLKVKGDAFVFEDGTPARFWGMNVTAYGALCPPQRAEQIAERLARLGCNIVRLHHLDSDWVDPNLIDRKHPDNTTQHLNPEAMRRLDKLVFELKKRGIYVVLDPWVGRTFRPGDNIPSFEKFGGGNFNLHPYVFFDPRIQSLLKKYLQQVWTHKNEYTQLAYKDDPAIALTELCNEALYNQDIQIEPYKSEYLKLYQAWAQQNDADPSATESILKQNFPHNNQRFYVHVMRTFYRNMLQFDRQQIGLKMPINASNWFHWPWEILSQADADFMDAHHYYGGDRIGPGYGVGGLWVASPVGSIDNPFGPIAAMAVAGKPLTVSECGNNPPKTYRSAYYVGLAAIASLQGWDAITPYAFTQSPEPANRLADFEMESDPATLASFAAGALIYRRGDVQPARQLALMTLPGDEVWAMHWENDGEAAFHNTPQFKAMLETHKVGVVLGGKVPEGLKPAVVMDPAKAFAYKHAGTQLTSDTGEVQRDWQAAVGTIDTPRTQAAYGKLGQSKQAWTTSDCSFNITTPYAMVSLSSLEDAPIATSSRLLLTVGARAEMTGQAYNFSRTKIVSGGQAPVLAEPVVGTVSFKTSASRLVGYPITADGKRGPAVPVSIDNGTATITLKPTHRTLFYRIEAPMPG